MKLVTKSVIGIKLESIGKPCSSKFEEYTQRIDPHEL